MSAGKFIFLFCLFKITYAANILFVTTTPSYGNQVVFQPIWKKLSESHKVTAITPNPINDKTLSNLKQISIKFIYELLEFKYNYTAYITEYKNQPLRYSTFVSSLMVDINREVLAHPDVHKLIEDDSYNFDLVIAELSSSTMLAFGHRFKCPVIAITATDFSILGQDAMGDPNHPVLFPDPMLKLSGELTFAQRTFSTLALVTRKILWKLVKGIEDDIILEFFGKNYPTLEELTDNIDLLLMNVNQGFHNLRPNVPAIVYFGGEMSIRPPTDLPQDIKKFLDEGKMGVVYFSLGTVVNTKMLGTELVQTIFTAFSKMSYRFVIKLDVPEEFPEKPDNFLIRKWFPQQDILRHPNTRIFITQCGLESIEEAIFYNIPIVGLPIFGDQFSNCLQAHRKGLGIVFDTNRLTPQMLAAGIEHVITNATYKDNTKVASQLALDQPMDGLNKAIWWIKYVLRHKGAKHLRTPSLNVPFWKYYLLDVLTLLGIIITAVLLTLYYCLKKCLGLCFKKTKTTKKNKVKKQ